MGKKKVRGRFTIRLNENDPAHEKVICLLENQPPRSKAQLLVNALLHYMNCPAATDGVAPAVNRSIIEEIVREVLSQQGMDKLPKVQENHPAEPQPLPPDLSKEPQDLQGGMSIAHTKKNDETFSLIADTLSAFRNG